MDSNGNALISLNELHDALKKAELDTKFEIKTVKLIVELFDMNSDGQIGFNEFQRVFQYLNNEYLAFLEIDENNNGHIEGSELHSALVSKKCQIHSNFSRFIVNEFDKVQQKITLDLYCRISVRLALLREAYSKDERNQFQSIEIYLKENFFEQFW